MEACFSPSLKAGILYDSFNLSFECTVLLVAVTFSGEAEMLDMYNADGTQTTKFLEYADM